MDFEKLYLVLPKDPIRWNSEDVGKWLNFIGLSNLNDKFQQASIDGACLSHITEEDLLEDLQIKQGIIRKKILNWLSVGVKEYSNYLSRSKNSMDQEQIKISDIPFNVFQKQCLESEFLRLQSNNSKLENTNKAMSIEKNENIYDMMTSNLKIPQNLNLNEHESKILNENQNIHNTYLEMMDEEPQKLKRQYSDNNVDQKCPISEVQLKIEKKPKQSRSPQKELINELIIQPSEGPQTNFYCINEQGGKIGRHSSNNILILEESISRHHAEIVFENEQFWINDIGSTTGTFIKIQEQLQLQEGMIIEMGSNQFLVTQTKPKTQTCGEIVIIIIEGPNIKKDYVLPFNDRTSLYNIGRKQNNEINMPDDHHLSNIHARIYYYEKKFMLEDLTSTNGSWLRLSKEAEQSPKYPLNDKTIFKIGTTSTYVCKKNSLMVNVFENQNSSACIICCEQDRDALYMPCKHNTCCVKCSKNLKECPICRHKIDDFIKIYKA